MPRKRRDKAHKRFRRQRESAQPVEQVERRVPEERENRNWFYNIYDKHYKLLLLIPIIMLVLSMGVIGFQVATTGDFIKKGVSLKGGVTMTVLTDTGVDVLELQDALQSEFPGEDIVVRSLGSSGSQVGILVEAGLDSTDTESISLLSNKVADWFGQPLEELEYSLEVMGSALGESFFKQTFKAILIAFAFMAGVVWYYFRIPVPSGAVILAAFSDMVVTLAIVDLMGMRISTAGIAAFLMLIGYSVDTDILLSTRVLKRSGGTVLDRTLGAMKTGLTMNLTTLAAITVALVVSESEVLKQIMTILMIGLIVDLINTWLQNAGILRWYLEKHNVDLKKLD